MKREYIFEAFIISAFLAAIIGAILNCLVFPIGFIFFHDCGVWICSHTYPVTWSSYWIITSVLFGVFFLFGLIMASCEDNAGSTSAPRRRTNYSANQRNRRNLETDYYDADMEGASGYYGFD